MNPESIDPQTASYLLYGLAAASGILGGALLARRKSVRYDQRADAIDVHAELKSEGLNELAALFKDRGTGAKFRVWQRVAAIKEMLSDPYKRETAFDRVFTVQLEKRLADEKKRGEILDAVDQHRALAAVREVKSKQTQTVAGVTVSAAGDG